MTKEGGVDGGGGGKGILCDLVFQGAWSTNLETLTPLQ